MRKILLAANAQEVKTSAVDFACYIANLTHSPLNGMLLENTFKKELAAMPVFAGNDVEEAMHSEKIAMETNRFANTCIASGARHFIHHIKGNALQEIIKESLYADLILTDGNTSFTDYEGWPSQFVRDLLANAKCPVIITPFDFDSIDEIVFSYDGTDSSVFAMKQFIYLFPQLNETKITLLQVLQDDDNITEKERLKTFLMMHYGAVHYDTLHGEADVELFRKFLAQKNKMLVMGAYGRKRMFSRSTADILLKTLNIPMFITHR